MITLLNKAGELIEFLAETRARASQGYSVRQLMASHIPDIGSEVKVTGSEVTAALRSYEVVVVINEWLIVVSQDLLWGWAGSCIFFVGACHYWGARPTVRGSL